MTNSMIHMRFRCFDESTRFIEAYFDTSQDPSDDLQIYLSGISEKRDRSYHEVVIIDCDVPVMRDMQPWFKKRGAYFNYSGRAYHLQDMFYEDIATIANSIEIGEFKTDASELLWSIIHAGVNNLQFDVYDKNLSDGTHPSSFQKCVCIDSGALVRNESDPDKRGWLTLISTDHTFSKTYHISDLAFAITDGLVKISKIQNLPGESISYFKTYMAQNQIEFFQ